MTIVYLYFQYFSIFIDYLTILHLKLQKYKIHQIQKITNMTDSPQNNKANTQPKYILLPVEHYKNIQNFIDTLTMHTTNFTMTCNRKQHLQNLISTFLEYNRNSQILYSRIQQQFNDGKINKRTLETQIQSLQADLVHLREKNQSKDKQAVQYISQLTKIGQQNEKFKQYIKKLKQDSTVYKKQMQQCVQVLSSKIQKYKLQYQQKQKAYKSKIKYLQSKIEQSNSIGQDLDKELQELAKLQAEVDQDRARQEQQEQQE